MAFPANSDQPLLFSLSVGIVAFALQRYFIHERQAIDSPKRNNNEPRKIFITGGASGIGRATAILFYKRGWTVGIADLNLDAAQRLAEELGQERAFAYKLDVTDPESCKRAVDEFCGSNGGGLDALFNCAGLLAIGMFAELDLKRQTNQIRVNLEGLVNMTHVALPHLKLCKQSVIVSMASNSSQAGIPTHAVYAATKAAVYSFTEAMAVELHQDQVRVCDVSVGYVGSPMLMQQENRKSTVMLDGPIIGPDAVAPTVFNAVHKARLHREHFYVEYSTAFNFKLQGFCRMLGIRLHMAVISFLCMPKRNAFT